MGRKAVFIYRNGAELLYKGPMWGSLDTLSFHPADGEMPIARVYELHEKGLKIEEYLIIERNGYDLIARRKNLGMLPVEEIYEALAIILS